MSAHRANPVASKFCITKKVVRIKGRIFTFNVQHLIVKDTMGRYWKHNKEFKGIKITDEMHNFRKAVMSKGRIHLIHWTEVAPQTRTPSVAH